MSFSDGIGGNVVADGTVQLLAVKTGTTVSRAVLDGYSYPQTSARYVRPSDSGEASRWDAVAGAYAHWSDLVSNPAVEATAVLVGHKRRFGLLRRTP
jgi:hypothetical protein